MWTAEEKSYIWLDSFALDFTFKNALVEEAGGAASLVKKFASFKGRFLEKGKVDIYEKMLATLQNDKYFKDLQVFLDKQGIVCITRATDGYFDSWRGLSDAPCVLYVKGDKSLLKTEIFAVVGSRKITDAYRKTGEELCRELAKKFTLITGVAEGGDETAARGGLQGGKVLCMLAGGFGEAPKDGGDFIADCERKGAVLAVCSFDTPVRNYSYERRNKLLAACAKGVLVLSAGEKSGTLKTAAYAQEFGKEVFALPYSPNAPTGVGCNALIKKGAHLAENSFDIFSRFGINLIEEEKDVPLLGDEALVYEGLQDLGESHTAALAEKVGLPVFKLVGVLSRLEIKGLVQKLGGNRYSVK